MTTANIIPRGIQNNNPANIDYSDHNDWNGQVYGSKFLSTENRFCVFQSPAAN